MTLAERIKRLKEQRRAVILAHNYQIPEVQDIADFVGDSPGLSLQAARTDAQVISTGGMSRYAGETPAREIIVGTEPGIIHRLKKENPDKIFHPVSDAVVCPNMKKTTLEKILLALEDMSHPIEVPKEVAERARLCIEAMLNVRR